jgi:hypothetical protein
VHEDVGVRWEQERLARTKRSLRQALRIESPKRPHRVMPFAPKLLNPALNYKHAKPLIE